MVDHVAVQVARPEGRTIFVSLVQLVVKHVRKEVRDFMMFAQRVNLMRLILLRKVHHIKSAAQFVRQNTHVAAVAPQLLQTSYFSISTFLTTATSILGNHPILLM